MIVFDIETGPLPDDQLRLVAPAFDPPQHPGEFDESSVKYGNTKDPEKRQQKLDDAKAAHAAAVAKHDREVEAARQQHWQEVVSKAALSATTGRVLAVGYQSPRSQVLDIDEDEAAMLTRFWQQVRRCASERRMMVGHNIAGFDIPFMARRSWINRVSVPDGVFNRRWLNDKLFADTMLTWQCSGFDKFASLDVVAKSLGVGGKTEGVTGAMFAELLAQDRAAAEEYLRNDLAMTAAVAERMGLI